MKYLRKSENKFLKQLKYFSKKWIMTEESIFKTLKESYLNKNRVQTTLRLAKKNIYLII